jgi:hypothetical protein
MPNRDGTGPMSKGPGTGAGNGKKAGSRCGQGSGNSNGSNGRGGQCRGRQGVAGKNSAGSTDVKNTD